jgi:hypothetical protein
MSADQTTERKTVHWRKPLMFFAWWIPLAAAVLSYVNIAYPAPSAPDFQIIRIVLALLAASLALVLTRFFDFASADQGVKITAAGALALFVVAYFLNLPRLVTATPPNEIVVSYTVCSGEYERNCNFPHESYLYCYVDPASWAKNVCTSFTVHQLSSYGGNKCGYTRYEVLCKKQAP